MKLKFYTTFFFLFFMGTASQAQYSIWKPVTNYPLPSADSIGLPVRVLATSDSNNVYFLVGDEIAQYYPAKLVRYDGVNTYIIDSVELDIKFLTSNGWDDVDIIVYKDKIYALDKNSFTSMTDNPISVLSPSKHFDTLVHYFQPLQKWRVAAPVQGAVVYKNELYVIGNISSVDTLKCHGIAKYNGSVWSTLGSGIDEGLPSQVMPEYGNLKIFNDKLYLLGINYDSVGAGYNFIGCWDGNSWLFKKTYFDISSTSFFDFHIINNKLYVSGSNSSTELFEVVDSNIFPLNKNFVVEGWSFSDLNNQVWSSGNRKIEVFDTTGVFEAPQYFLPEKYFNSKFIEFKNKIYAYGDFEVKTSIGDTLRYIAQTDAKMNKISGKIYYDNDSNCSFGTGDESSYSELLKIMPGPVYANTDAQGNYKLLLCADTVTMEPVLRKYWKLNSCSPSKYVLFANDTLNHNNIDFAFGKKSLVSDLSINLDAYTGWRARRGFTDWYSVNIKNNGTLSDSGTLKLYYSNKFQIEESYPKADSITATWAEWRVPAIGINKEINIQFSAHIDTTYHNNDTLVVGAEMINSNDVYSNDNDDTLTQIVRNSHDPNSIQVFSNGQDSEIHIINPSQRQLEYLIHFENTGTDTAYNITVVDTLDGRLDMSTFELASHSHYVTCKILPYEFSSGSHLMKFVFNNILLPPKDTLQTMQTDNGGFVSYKIQLKNNLPIGTEISNRAYIYFDYNSAVETNTSIVKIDTTIANGITQLQPFSSDQTIFYWPVPTSDKLFVMNLLSTKQQLEFYNIEGKKLRMYSLHANETSAINTENLPSGVYFIRSLNNGAVYKLVKE